MSFDIALPYFGFLVDTFSPEIVDDLAKRTLEDHDPEMILSTDEAKALVDAFESDFEILTNYAPINTNNLHALVGLTRIKDLNIQVHTGKTGRSHSLLQLLTYRQIIFNKGLIDKYNLKVNDLLPARSVIGVEYAKKARELYNPINIIQPLPNLDIHTDYPSNPSLLIEVNPDNLAFLQSAFSTTPIVFLNLKNYSTRGIETGKNMVIANSLEEMASAVTFFMSESYEP